ncbi:TylF/MycF/NovP-related O-methyltransferase [Nocardioides sp.]|uniref:TylF/MycF/NovP-related O-methyltransferase n=1 Tax=Nocardioides sp. TaxID=35761 RepID=UPI003D150560
MSAQRAAQPDPVRLREKLAKTTRSLKQARHNNQRLRSELELLRAFTRDPWPGIELSAEVETVVAQVMAQRLTYLEEENLRALARLVVEADTSGREGLVIEAGTALGGSAIVMAAAKDPARPMRVFDVFGLIPPPSDNDPAEVHERYAAIARGESQGLGGDEYYGYREDLKADVTASFSRLGVPIESHGVELVKGLFHDTLVIDEPVALAHLDGDWYESTMVCLERVTPHLVPGGRIVLDDYYFWEGSRAAVTDYFAGRSGFRIEHRAKAHVVRE